MATSRLYRPPPERAPCAIDGCRATIRTTDHPTRHSEFYCAKHWRIVPALLKRLKRRHEREWERCGFYPREEAYRRLIGRVVRIMAGEPGLATEPAPD